LSTFDQWVAFAELLPNVEWEGNVVEGKRIIEVRPSPARGALVSKLGAKTGLTKGGRIGVRSVHADVFVGAATRRLADVIEVIAEADPFCEPGDGGGLVFMPDSLEAVGIIVGATSAARNRR
jgi:hypothetical protein